MNCASYCDPNHGLADVHGKCICDSTRFIGEDCSIEIEESYNFIPDYLIKLGHAMVISNLATRSGPKVTSSV